LTFAPIDKTLVEKSLLTDSEIAWLNSYHYEVREKLEPLIEGDVAEWLRLATAPL